MENPFAHLLPSAMQILTLSGARFVLLLGIMLFFGSVGGRIFQKLKIPQVVGYIVVGILLGVSGTWVLGPETVTALNPVSTIDLSPFSYTHLTLPTILRV
ncbi:MAG: hypothetical protein K2I74_10005 [Treponemataceae bacterium]|nr:hypothetical protein [Treponemataceae bacterium]